MEAIESKEVVGTPTATQGPPPRQVCVMIQYIGTGGSKVDAIFHEDLPEGFDHDGKFRARVGAALSAALDRRVISERYQEGGPGKWDTVKAMKMGNREDPNG